MYKTAKNLIAGESLSKGVAILIFGKSILFLMKGIVSLDVIISKNLIKISGNPTFFGLMLISLFFVYIFSKFEPQILGLMV